MIDKKYQPLVFSFFMSLLMSGLMSLVISIFNVGLTPDIISLWLKAWAFAFIIAFPAIIIVTPVVRKLSSLIIRNE